MRTPGNIYDSTYNTYNMYEETINTYSRANNWKRWRQINMMIGVTISLRERKSALMNYHLTIAEVQSIRDNIDAIERQAMDTSERFSMDQYGWRQLMNLNIDDFVMYDFYKNLLHKSIQEMLKEMGVYNSELERFNEQLRPLGIALQHRTHRDIQMYSDARHVMHTWQEPEPTGNEEEKKDQEVVDLQ